MVRDSTRRSQRRSSQGAVQSRRARPGEGPLSNLDELEARISLVRERWNDQRRIPGRSPDERGSSVLKRELYQLALELDPANGGASTLGDNPKLLVRRLRKRLRPRARSKPSLFAALLSIVASDEELPRGEKKRYVQELSYARKHKVPAELLIGFILQVGPETISLAAEDGRTREPWFDRSRVLKWTEVSD